MQIQNQTITISFIIPAKNEQNTLSDLVDKIFDVFKKMAGPYRLNIILIDDGSTDSTWEKMRSIAQEHSSVIQAFRLRKNFGKSAALELGFRHAHGDIVFTMDADLQDDPDEIPKFINAIHSGYDLVSGWKKIRHDPISKTIPSWFFNKITSKISGIKLHDFNCGFKAYRNDVIKSVRLYGELHRFIPLLAHDYGFSVTEIEVLHHPRTKGKSKYGWERYFRGLVDLLTVIATTRWMNRPGHFFGGIAFITGISGAAILAYLFFYWILGLGPIGQRPLLFFGILLSISSLQIFSIGILAEIFIKTSQKIDPNIYIAESINNKP